MNILLTISLLLLIGYSAGLLLNKIGLPKIIGYIATGIAFNPKTNGFINYDILEATQPLLDVCLAFIAFEVGGALKWSIIKRHEKEIISITLLASIFPFIFVVIGVYVFGLLFPSILPFNNLTLLFFALLMGALASPTEPASTISVVHQYNAKGKVTDTIMGVVALDDVLGILLFSLTIGLISLLNPSSDAFVGNAVLNWI
jgi:Kef-type K+ transport system membrane component KefB